jgi:hypothetical protein
MVAADPCHPGSRKEDYASGRVAACGPAQAQRKGRTRFWQRGGGYARTLWSARAIWNMIEYIHMNPGAGWAVRARIGLAMVERGVLSDSHARALGTEP